MNIMKTKTIITTVLLTIFVVFVTLFVYTHLVNNSKQTLNNKNTVTDEKSVPAFLTAMQVQEGPVDFTYAAERTVHAVVHVRTRSTVTFGGESDNPLFDFFYGDTYRQRPRKVTGYGSGVIISSDGYIITNNHVIEGADSIQVTLNNNKKYDAKLIGKDPDSDIALLKIKAENLPTIKYGDSDKLKLGEWVLAVGNPFNLTSTVTAGIISALGRSLNFDEGDNSKSYKIEAYIQTDAALNVGNSGGALVNTKAELIGITAAIISPTGTYSGNSFAIPVNIVKKVVNDLLQYGKVQRGMMGINIVDVTSEIADKEKLNNVSGVSITSVNAGGAAEAAGLKARDIIVRINNTNILNSAELQETVSLYRPGDKLNVTFVRGGKENTVVVELKNVEGTTSVVVAGTGETVFGCKVVPLSSQEKKKFDVDFGVKVTDVGEGKLKELGIRKGTIISVINGKRVNNASEIREATSDEENINSIEGMQPNGTIFSYQFKY
jgi:serine protease Do